jgi:hypothetical protein
MLEKTGFDSPWKNRQTFNVAAGDDVCVWIPSSHRHCFERSVYEVCAKNKTTPSHGLGQCVTDIFVREWWNIDFCSKWSFIDNSGKWILTRDWLKAVCTKQSYGGSNADIFSNPLQHAEAIYEGALAEGITSGILHDVLRARCAVLAIPGRSKLSQWQRNRYNLKNARKIIAQNAPLDSTILSEIDSRCGLNSWSLLSLMDRGVLALDF